MGLKIFEIKEQCTACGACVSVCPKDALTLEPDQYFGFYYPEVNQEKCVECHLCEKTCHVLSGIKGEFTERKPYMLKAKDKELLKQSSSGGAFSLLADNVLKEGGIVYGAAYDYEQEKLVETSTDVVALDELRKSKYIESFCGGIFRDIEAKLREGRKVMFCGTPCQVKGLNQYLTQKKCPKEQILLVQILCHGVPSNQFFTEYKHWLEKRCNGKITAMDFRSKKYGWRTPYYYYYYYGTGRNTVRGDSTYYMSAFFKYYMLRDSCYGCTIFDQGYADITIADFWGLFRYDPQNKDNEGLSLLIAHNDKGQKSVEELKNVSVFAELPLSAIDYTRKPHRHVQESLEKKRMMEREIAQQGYMPYMEKILKKPVMKAKFKDRIAKILFTLRIWKINK